MKKSNKYNQRKSSLNSSNNNRSEIAGLINDAKVYCEKAQYEQANYLYQRVICIDSGNISALNGLGVIAMETGMLSLAVEFFHYALDVNPKNIEVNENLSTAYIKMSCFEEAIIQNLCILDFDENNCNAHSELARLNYQTGNKDLALQHYQYAFELNPEDPGNFHGMVQVDASVISNEYIAIVEELLLKSDLPLDVRCSFYFSLGTIYDITGRYDEAFANFSVANISKGASFDADKYAAYITDIIHTFTPDLFDKYSLYELNGSTQPVFVVGMPQSGADIVEDILSTQAEISSAGEINIIAGIAHKLNVTMDKDKGNDMCLEDISAETLNNYSRFYINDINDVTKIIGHKNSSRILNTMPANFLHLGLIAVLFPNAHIIHCKRNPMDVCLSSYFGNFTGENGYACDLTNIAFYYRQYERLMNYWGKTLPINIHTVNYEELVKQPVKAGQQLADYLNLAWHPVNTSPGDIGINSALADTALSTQKTTRSSGQRWRNYEKYLHFMKKRLNKISSLRSDIAATGI